MTRPAAAWLARAQMVICACLAVAAFSPMPVRAQAPAPRGALAMLAANPDTEAALAAPFGARLAARLASHLEKGAEPKCVADRRLDGSAFAALARTLLIRIGKQVRDFNTSALRMADAESAFARHIGAGVAGEVERILADDTIKRLIALKEEQNKGDFILYLIDQFDRALLLRRIDLGGRISPLATGDMDLLMESEALSQAVDDFVRDNDTPSVKRIIELLDTAAIALQANMDEEKLLKFSPTSLLEPQTELLEEHCIIIRR